jgi:hypothetical protein
MAWHWIHVSLIFWMVVLWFQIQKQNCMVLCLKSFGIKCTHSHVPGCKGESLFLDFNFFVCLPVVDYRRTWGIRTS